MAEDTKYGAIPFIYDSKGLIARDVPDQCPPYTYLQNLNCLERAENAMSSRYGTTIINRDAAGVGTSNYYFSAPVTSLSRLTYQSSAFRYAGLQDGTLWRRSGNGQGAYAQIDSGLSGLTFQSAVATCFETSQAYLFIADTNISLKDNGILSAPQLWGIDPPALTANALPYSPLLTLIDNFATGNSYSSSGFDAGGAWAFANVTTIDAANGALVTDFPQFSVTGASIAGGSVSVTQSVVGGIGNEATFSGFSSTPVSAGQTVTVIVVLDGTAVITGSGASGSVAESQTAFAYSADSGVTWSNSIYVSPFNEFSSAQTFTYPTQTITLTIPGLTNLDTLQFQASAFANIFYTNGLTSQTTATITSIYASVADTGIWGEVCDGILSVLNTNTSAHIPIATVASSDLSSSVYTTLTITTAAAHGLTGTPSIAIYGSSNDLVDGFYTATVVDTVTLTVPFYSVNAIGAAGGYLEGGAAAPAECVISNEYSTPYPVQFSAWGFYQQVPTGTTSFPIGSWSGLVDASSTATVGVTANFDLSINNQVTDADLIVLTLNVGSPENIANIRLQFDVNSSGYSSSYYYANITPAYYQGNIANNVSAYQATQSQILADTLGLITGQPPATTTAQLQPSNMSTGSGAWAAVLIPRGNFLPVGSAGQSGLDWTNITGWQVVIETTDGGTSTVSMNGLYLQWGYGPSSFSGVGYNYRYTYYNANTGTESSPSPEMFFNELYGYLASLAAPFYLRQAVQVTGLYSTDSQVTHVRMYRQGGTRNDNWLQIDQVPNLTGAGTFFYKDVVADAALQQAQILVLDNDPPVTSSLVNPIQTTLLDATVGPGNSIYSLFSAQTVQVADSTVTFVPNQIVVVGSANNLEVATVITGGMGQFNTILRLQHNAGEQVNVYSIPRQASDICTLAYDQLWLVDPLNPSNAFYSKKGQPENFGPENYITVSSPDDPIMALINWRGTLLAATLKTWYILANGATKPQPTGAAHGMIAKNGWTLVEGRIWFRAADGLRAFVGADGEYMTLPVEWIFRNNPMCLAPQAAPSQASQDVMAYYNNCVYDSYVSSGNGITETIAGGTVSASGTGSATNTHTFSGFAADVIDNPANLSIPITSSTLSTITGGGSVTISYSVDGGSTWIVAATFSGPSTVIDNIAPQTINVLISVTNANLVQVKVAVQALVRAGAVNISMGIGTLTLTPSLLRYRLVYDTQYRRFRYDDVAATAMLWEQDTNAFLVGKQIAARQYAVVQDWVGDYDDGGWVSGALVQTPINIAIQHPYRDLGKPHDPKQWNMLDTDVNTQGQVMTTTLLFDDGETVLALANQNTGTTRQKCEMIINSGDGQQAYRASILHTMAVTVAPTLYQEDIYAAVLAEYNGSYDTYWLKFGIDNEKFIKEGFFDYTSPIAVSVSLFADGSSTPYFTFQLPAQPNRGVIRVRFGNLNSGTTAFSMRTWRMIALTTSVENPLQAFQFWRKPQVKWKPLGQHSYKIVELEV